MCNSNCKLKGKYFTKNILKYFLGKRGKCLKIPAIPLEYQMTNDGAFKIHLLDEISNHRGSIRTTD